MDQMKQYQSLIKEALQEYAAFLNLGQKPYQVVVAFDDERQQYILRKLGWTTNRRIRQTVLHLSIHDGKIWIEEDWTEDGIATYLLTHGVPPQEMVLAFQPPESRGELIVLAA